MERGRPIEKYGKKQQKEWLNNILSDRNPCTQEERGKAPLVW